MYSVHRWKNLKCLLLFVYFLLRISLNCLFSHSHNFFLRHRNLQLLIQIMVQIATKYKFPGSRSENELNQETVWQIEVIQSLVKRVLNSGPSCQNDRQPYHFFPLPKLDQGYIKSIHVSYPWKQPNAILNIMPLLSPTILQQSQIPQFLPHDSEVKSSYRIIS